MISGCFQSFQERREVFPFSVSSILSSLFKGVIWLPIPGFDSQFFFKNGNYQIQNIQPVLSKQKPSEEAIEFLKARSESFNLDYNSELLKDPEFFAIFTSVVEALEANDPKECLKKIRDLAFDHLNCFCYSSKIHRSVLQIVLYSKNPDCTDAASAFLRALETQTRPSSKDTANKIARAVSNWAQSTGCNDSKIKISFGGGGRFLSNFLEKRSNGYETESGVEGIFVTIQDERYADSIRRSRDDGYATAAALKNFDSCCVLKAEIDPKKLIRVNSNFYEAVLLPKEVSSLKNIQKATWDIMNFDFSSRKECFREVLPAGRIDLNMQTSDWRPILESRAGTLYNLERKDRVIQAYNEFKG